MKTYILYHGNCPDGFGAAFAAWLRFGADAEYIPVSYGKPVPQIERGSKVFIVDFSYPRNVLEELGRNCCDQLVVLDHHATAKDALEGLPGCHFDMTKSGAVMTWEYFHPDLPVPEFFLYLQDRDLWQFKLPKSREVSMALRSYPMDFKTWSDISGIVPFGQIYELPGIKIDDLKKEGVACRRLTEQQVENMARHHRWAIFQNLGQDGFGNLKPAKVDFSEKAPFGGDMSCYGVYWTAPVANATVFFSEVGEKLLEMYPGAPFAAYYTDRTDGKRQFGLRSRQDFDCSVIAKAFGGGGHKQASGFVL